MLIQPMNLHGYSAHDLLDCPQRELGYRRRVYANRVLTHRMTQDLADREIDRMAAIAEHFAELAERERLLATLEKTITFNRDNKFDIQLSKALICERRLAEVFRFGEFDTTIELKSESWQWRRTGNIAIEYLCDGKPSGISVCKAGWWVHELCDDDGATLLYIMVTLERLKALARAAIRDGRSRQGGDDKRYRMAVINVSDLLTLALPERDGCQLSPK